MSKTIGLIDGDVIAYRAAAAVQNVIEWPSGYVEYFARRADGEAAVDGMMAKLKAKLSLDQMRVFLSSDTNWRLEIDPTYKGNRKDSVRPLLLSRLKDYLRERYEAIHYDNLEADDAIGVWLSRPSGTNTRIAIGKDKDFFTVPGKHFQLGMEQIREISPLEARLWHYTQTLSGDVVDGYAGCPGIGKKRAQEIVQDPRKLIPKAGVITRGKNKGKETTKWHDAGPCSVWEAVVSNYEKAGLQEQDAIRTARLANILQAHQYDIDTGQITLWVPGKE